MGIFDRVTDRLRRGSSSQSGPSSSRQEDDSGEAAPAWDWEEGEGGDERASLIDEELPRYEEIFDTGPLDSDYAYAPGTGEKRKSRVRGVDPRRRHVLPSAGRLPSAVVDILCSRGHLSPSTMFRVSLVSHRLYDVVMPHLYRRVPIERGSIHKLLYGIPLPVQGFVYDPSSDGKGKGKAKEREVEEEEEQKRRYGYTSNRSIHDRETERYRTESAAISAASEGRKRRCLSLIREVWLESVIPDWTTCRSLAILGDPGRRFKDTSDNSPSELQYHPMRQSEPQLPPRPEMAKDKEKSGPITECQPPAHTAIPLMPNVDTLHVRAEAIQAMIHWERVDRSPHLLPDALASLCEPTTVHVHGSVMALTLARWQPDKIERAKMEVNIEKTIRRLCTAGNRTKRVQTFVWHGVEADSLPYIPDCHMAIHFTPASTPVRHSKMNRIIQIRQALHGANVSTPLDWRFHDPGLVDQNTEDEHDSIVRAVLHGGLEGLDPLPFNVTSRVEFIRSLPTPSATSPSSEGNGRRQRYGQQGGAGGGAAQPRRLLDVSDADLAEVEPSLQNLYLQRTSTGRMQ